VNEGRTVFAQLMDCLPKYELDSTTMDLCLSLFPWAKFRRHKAAIKLHTLLALRDNYPGYFIRPREKFWRMRKRLERKAEDGNRP
jgi:hypothetical protein